MLVNRFRVRRFAVAIMMAWASGCGTASLEVRVSALESRNAFLESRINRAIPPQQQFQSIKELASQDDSFVRIYSAPIPSMERVASHCWFVIKRRGSAPTQRWEVWQSSGPPHGHLRKDIMAPEAGVGGGAAVIIDEIIGPAAEPIVEFIETQSPNYPCRHRYVLLGQNSNTYPQWVIDHTGWETWLPLTAIGQTVRCED